MNCSNFEELISDYVEGLLVRPQTGLFASHALQCRPCRTMLDEVKAALGLCKHAGEAALPADLEASLLMIPAEHRRMDCAGFEEIVTEFLDGFVPASLYHRFEEHTAECGSCSRLLTDVVYAVAACHSVHTYEEYPAPEGLIERLLAIMPERRRGAVRSLSDRIVAFAALLIPRATHDAGWSFATASVLAFASFSFLLFGFSDDQTVAGIYRQARLKAAGIYTHGADIYAQKNEVVAGLHRVGSDIGEIWETLGGEGGEVKAGEDKRQPAEPDRSTEVVEKNGRR